MKKISEIKTALIDHIFHKAHSLKLLQENIAVFLPKELVSHCHVANFEKGILIFAVENSAWAMKFRYLTADLLKQLRAHANLPQLSAIQYYIEPEFLSLFKGVNVMEKRASRGFTTLELIVAIVIIVGLAGVLVPRFMAQASFARTVAINAMASAVRSSVALAVIEYRTGGMKPEVKIANEMVKVSTSGYPLGTAEGIGAALKSVQGFVPMFGSSTIFNLSAPRDNCNVSYVPATGVVTSDTLGC